jgi:hypothetical protein
MSEATGVVREAVVAEGRLSIKYKGSLKEVVTLKNFGFKEWDAKVKYSSWL